MEGHESDHISANQQGQKERHAVPSIRGMGMTQ